MVLALMDAEVLRRGVALEAAAAGRAAAALPVAQVAPAAPETASGKAAHVSFTRQEWDIVRADLWTRERKYRAQRRHLTTPEIEALRAEIRDITKTAQAYGWTSESRSRIRRVERQLQEATEEVVGAETLLTLRYRYAFHRSANYIYGLDATSREIAEAIARQARAENAPLPPEVLSDYPDLGRQF